MKKTYLDPEIKVTGFSLTDIVTTSGLTSSGTGTPGSGATTRSVNYNDFDFKWSNVTVTP